MKKKWQKRLVKLVTKLGFGDKMKTGTLTADEQKQLFAEYEKEYSIAFQADREADDDDDDSDDDDTNILSPEDQISLASIFGPDKPKTKTEAVPALVKKVKEQEKTIGTLSKVPEPVIPAQTVKAEQTPAKVKAITLGIAPHTSSHLFGIEDKIFARGRWDTELMVSRTPMVSKLNLSRKKEFKNILNDYSQKLMERAGALEKDNLLGSLDFKKMIAGESAIDYSDLFGKAGEYIVRRTDLILAYIRTLPSVDSIFPMVSNIQNKEIAPGANFGELSQGYRAGKIFKGNVAFTAEIYSVVDVMFKFLFKDLIKLEKQYIGYLNREGSNVIKWTFIEWIMVHFGTILRNEQNMRRVTGVRVPQQDVVANPAMLAADGIYRALDRVEKDLKIYPNHDYRIYDETTIVNYFEAIWDFYTQVIPSMDGYKLYANLKHRSWYIRNFRDKYGRDSDFSGVTPESVIDVDANIVWVPNMQPNNYKIMITIPGNAENYEDKPFEMLAFYFERDWEEIGVMSRWKEGAGFQQAGIQYKTPAELVASEYASQWIFTNYPASTLAPDATIVNARLNILFETAANTADTEITDIQNMNINNVIRIVCGSMTNATTITKGGKFANITSDWEPAAVGDYIELYAELEDYTEVVDNENVTMTRPTGNYLELERKITA
ncbi:MAG: hypothetical protein LBR26_13395 [Prevotella sp.]|jgi:hypothetical protein|nr:hypothetical protein [Prevotella sp.]